MESFPRRQVATILEDLKEKMVFLSGPRQVGKTFLSRQVLKKRSGTYLNWDQANHRKIILKGQWPTKKATVVLDEIHKYKRWKNLVKGEFDQNRDRLSFLVTGSARLNIYRRGGDSLQGRYHRHRLHPFSVCESEGIKRLPEIGEELVLPDHKGNKEIIEAFITLSGFPEPFLRGTERAYRRWSKERLDRVIQEDIRDLSNVHDISLLQILAEMLPDRAASLLSLNNLREDLEVSHRAISSWVTMMENLYLCFRVHPFHRRLSRTLRKETKLYLFDCASPPSKGARFENLIALHLLKFCHALEDWEGYRAELWFIRDTAQREVDFVVTIDRKPWFAVEAKTGNKGKSHLAYFGSRLEIPFLFAVSLEPCPSFRQDNIIHTDALTFLRALGV